MKKTFKKASALAMAGTLAVAGVGVLPAVTASAEDEAIAHLSINNDAWSEFDAEYVDATITGDGQYTVSMTATEGQSLVQFQALEVANGEALLGTASVLTIDSISINGEEVELTGKSFTCSADGGGVNTRVNLYNEWNAPDETATAGDDNHLDQRTAEGSVMDCTATLFDSSYVNASSGSGFLVESIEVTFTVSNYGVNAEAGEGAEEVTYDGPAIAHLSINNDAWSEYEAEYIDAEITGDGEYTVSMTATEGQSLVQFNALQVPYGEIVMGTASVLTINSIKINGEDVELLGNSYTCSADGNGVDTRVNIYNEWNAPDATATAGYDAHLDHRTAAASLDDTTAVLFDSSYVNASSGSGFLVESIEVTFTVSNFGVNAEAGEVEEAAALDKNGVYHAYIGIQGPKYTFRDGYDNASTGFGTDFFNQLTFQGDTAEGTSVPATFNDAEIAGNGTYTVSATGIEWPEDEFADQDYMNLIFFSTDIPYSDEITFSDIVLKINGSEVADVNPLVNDENVEYLTVQLQSIWNDQIKSIGYYAVPFSDIEITFTVSGFDYDNEAPAETPAETPVEEPTEVVEEEKSGVSPVPFIICGVVVVAAAVCAVVVIRKKKSA